MAEIRWIVVEQYTRVIPWSQKVVHELLHHDVCASASETRGHAQEQRNNLWGTAVLRWDASETVGPGPDADVWSINQLGLPDWPAQASPMRAP